MSYLLRANVPYPQQLLPRSVALDDLDAGFGDVQSVGQNLYKSLVCLAPGWRSGHLDVESLSMKAGNPVLGGLWMDDDGQDGRILLFFPSHSRLWDQAPSASSLS